MNDFTIKPFAVGPSASARAERPAAAPGNREGFGSILKDSLGEVNKLHHEANQAVEALTAAMAVLTKAPAPNVSVVERDAARIRALEARTFEDAVNAVMAQLPDMPPEVMHAGLLDTRRGK